MTTYYDMALFIPSDKTLAEVSRIMEALDDMGVFIDWNSLMFSAKGMSFEAQYTRDLTPEQIESSGVKIDWDTMSEWDIEKESE